MNELIDNIKIMMADNVAIKFKSHGYHWNVEGYDFRQFHEFFGEIYENFDAATDVYAEWLRSLKEYAPYRLVDFFDMSGISESEIVGDAQPMIVDLYYSIEKHIADLVIAVELANKYKQYGLSNFLADRQTISQKFCWQLRSSFQTEDIK